MEFIGTHEIEEYNLRINEAPDPPSLLSRVINLKLKPLTHGVEPDVVLYFDSRVTKMFGSVVKGNIFNAVIAVGLNESQFDDIYAVLRSEKPVYFQYVAAADWTDPFDSATVIDISLVSIYTGQEQVGEVERPASNILALRRQTVLSELKKKASLGDQRTQK
jgi:hypothetical protein